MSLLEKGDIGCAVQVLLMMQAGYARQDKEFTRGMRDVALKALEVEIDSYVESMIKPYKTVGANITRASMENVIKPTGVNHA